MHSCCGTKLSTGAILPLPCFCHLVETNSWPFYCVLFILTQNNPAACQTELITETVEERDTTLIGGASSFITFTCCTLREIDTN